VKLKGWPFELLDVSPDGPPTGDGPGTPA